jgi:hypothetical protein
MQNSSQARSVSDFNPGIHDPVVLDSGPALFPGYPWGWPTDGIPYEVALPPNFELAHIRKRKRIGFARSPYSMLQSTTSMGSDGKF